MADLLLGALRVAEKKRALICEDDAAIRRLVETVAKREGFDVEVAEDGEQGMEKLRGNTFELIVLDLMMPGVDGYGVINFIEHQKPRHVKRIIVMTAAAQAIKGEFPQPICRLLPKPFDIVELTKALSECAAACGEEAP